MSAAVVAAAGSNERLPPQDIEAERAMLGAMLLSEQAVADVLTVATARDVYRPAHQAIFSCIVDLHERGEPVDAIVVAAELNRRGELLRVGGGPYLHTLISTVPVASNAEYYADLVVEKAKSRRHAEVLTRGLQRIHMSPEGADETFARTLQELSELGHAISAPAPREHLSRQLLTLSGLGKLPPVRPLVEGLLYRGTLAQLTGAPGSYKSFLAVGMACAVAAGVAFEDHAVPDGGGPVVYVAAEGASGLRARILAWCELAGVDPSVLEGRLFILPVPVQLGNSVDIAEAVEVTREIAARLLVLDTRARCTVGLEENSSTEQGTAIAAVDTLIRETDCTVMAVHHSGRGGGAGRGSNAWDGAAWSDLRISSEHLLATVGCHKHKDVEAGCEHSFRMVPRTVSQELMPESSEQQRATLVAVAADGRQSDDDDAPSRTLVSDIVRTCDGPEGLTRSQIIGLAVERGLSRSTAYAAVKDLVRRGAIRNVSTGKTERYVAAGGHVHSGGEAR